MKRSQKLSAAEILDLIESQWLSNAEIAKLAYCGLSKAIEIRKEITEKLEKEKYFVPPKLVPTAAVIEYLNIDVNYLKRIIKIKNECEGKKNEK